VTDQTPANWYPDRDSNGELERWWSGAEWTDHTRKAQIAPASQGVPTPIVSQPPGAAPPIPFAPQVKKRGGMPKWVWAVGGLVILVIIIAVAAGGGSKKNDNSAGGATSKLPDHAEDVAITGCVADATTGYLQASVTVKNNSSKTSNYAITIAFESKDKTKQLDTGLVAVNDLASGQSSDQTAIGLSPAPAGGYTCKLADITRYASQ
jgi:hypothetical protein